MHFSSAVLAALLSTLTNACFCPSLISSSCGCGGGGGGYNAYAGGGYGGGGYAQNTGSYAVFYRDLTPFRQPYYQAPQYYPRAPAPQLPPMYQLPNPRYIQPQAPPQPQPQYIAPAPVIQPSHPTLIQSKQVYIQPAATVAPIVDVPRTTLHDNGYGEEEVIVTTAAPPTAAPVEDAPDFVDEAPVKTANGEKDEFYYVYYDDKGNKVGDSRSGSTFAPENVIEEVTSVAPASVHLEVTTQLVQEEANENYDDVVEETQVPVRTSLAPSYTPEVVTSTTILFIEPGTQATAAPVGTDVVYEDETVEYEDEVTETTAGPIVTKKPTSSGNYKRTVQDNQILVDAAENPGEGYRSRISANGVKIVKRYRHDKRKIHEN
ncbi:unnamed protein product [Caenorhabditis sp. 36 PRJEB53466]|nr:unnamed protein product [Caenorhabditis sp. 36 PRJEB53466]